MLHSILPRYWHEELNHLCQVGRQQAKALLPASGDPEGPTEADKMVGKLKGGRRDRLGRNMSRDRWGEKVAEQGKSGSYGICLIQTPQVTVSLSLSPLGFVPVKLLAHVQGNP